MKDLFICATPLQCLIVESILKQESLDKNKIEIFYYSTLDNDINRLYYTRLSEKFSEGNYFLILKKIYNYFPLLKAMFGNRKYNNIYLSNLNSPLIHFILSKIYFKNIITFDDGIGNLVNTSVYFIYKKTIKSTLRSLVYYLLGNRYSLEKIKSRITKHYTIYPENDNVVETTVPLNIFNYSIDETNKVKKNKCIVILGTVYSDLINNKKNIKLSILKIQNYLSQQACDDVVYIPHPRDTWNYFPNLIFDDRAIIAEEKIIFLLNQYNTVMLYGFFSTAQLNLFSLSGIKNHYFWSEKFRVDSGYVELVKRYNFSEINLDFFS